MATRRVHRPYGERSITKLNSQPRVSPGGLPFFVSGEIVLSLTDAGSSMIGFVQKEQEELDTEAILYLAGVY